MIGLLAAAMLVPGTAQREVAKVGEEPMVKEVSMEPASTTLNSTWRFEGTPGQSPTNPMYYQLGAPTNCPSGSATVCILLAPADSNGKPKMDAEVEVEGEAEPQTVEERIIDALANGPNETVTQLRSN